MMRKSAAPVLCTLAVLAALGTLAWGAAPLRAAEPSVTVSAEGVVTAAPDMATVRAGVTSDAATAAAALDENSAAVAKIFALLDRLGIAARDRRTAGFNVHPVYAGGEKGQAPKLAGYRVSNAVEIRVRKLAGLGDLLDRLVAAGANRVTGVDFGIADPDALADDARKRAMVEARRRAALYAAEAGAKLGRVLSISEEGGAPRPMLRAMVAREGNAVPVAPGELSVRIVLRVSFALDE